MTRVVQVSFHRDRLDRPAETLLDAWPTLSRVAEAAAGAGFDVTVVQPAAEDRIIGRNGVTYRFVRERPGLRRGPTGSRPVRRSAPRLGEVVRELDPEVVHVQGLSLPGHAARLLRRVPRATLLAQDHADRPPRPLRRPVARRAFASHDAVAFTAREQARPFIAVGLFEPDLPVCEVLESSTDFGPGDPVEARRSAGIYGDPCLVWVGRLDPSKDPLTVLEGFARAAPALPDPHMWCCYTDAPLLDVVRRRISSDPLLKPRVHLLGTLPRPEVEVLLRGADLFVLGSRREGSGYALLEAMACGATPVVTDIPSFRRIAGGAGRHFPPGDPGAAADALAAAAAEPRERARGRTLERFRSSLSWDAVGRELGAAYETCLTGERRGASTAGEVGSAGGDGT